VSVICEAFEGLQLTDEFIYFLAKMLKLTHAQATISLNVFFFL
jgi:hypothetical protein